MDIQNQPLSFAVLHDVIGVPTAGGKMVNLKATIGPEVQHSPVKAMTLMGQLVYLELTGGTALVPVSNFKLLVPTPDAKN